MQSMAAQQAPRPDTQSGTEQGPQISGPASETSVSQQRVDLNLNLAPPIAPYPYMLLQSQPHGYASYPGEESQQSHYQQNYVPGIHGEHEGLYPEEAHHVYGFHQPLQQEVHQSYPEHTIQQQAFTQAGEVYGQLPQQQPVAETRHQGQGGRILPRRLPHARRVRRRNRVSRAHIMHINTVAADIAYNNREHSTATSLTGSVTSGPIPITPLHIESSQERLTRLTSAVSAAEENSSIGENFECNICFQKANEAVVTCCGHLFCWPCLYRWLHVHSYHKECPVCKGAIAEYSITPIYGRENALVSARMQGALGSERIPPRPQARRIESARQQRDREEREREREERERAVREAVAREINPESINSEIAQVVTEIEEVGEEPRAPGADIPNPQVAPQRVEEATRGEEGFPTRTQDPEPVMQQITSRAGGEPTRHPPRRGYLQRSRRDQLREALQLRDGLANSRNSAAMNQNLRERIEERQHMMAAAQEWEDIISVSRLVVNPVQAAAWLASMRARLTNMEGNVENNPDATNTQQRRQMMASAITHLSEDAQEEDSVSRLVVNPSQSADWIAAMRSRLNNIELLMQGLDRPIGGNIQNWSEPVGNSTQHQLREDDHTSNDSGIRDPEQASGSGHVICNLSNQGGGNLVVMLNTEDEVHDNIVPENVSRRGRRREEEPSPGDASVVANVEGGAAQEQLSHTRKRRRFD